MDLIRKEWTQKDYTEFIEFLKTLSDKEFKNFNQKLVCSPKEVIGIRIPDLKKISKIIAKGNYDDYIKICNNDYYEEVLIHGFIIGEVKKDFNLMCNYIKSFVPLIDSWAVCDCTAANLKAVKKCKSEFYEFIQEFFKSDREFELRFAFIILLDYYVEEKYLDSIFQLCDDCTSDFYYVKMGIAWLLSLCYIRYPKETMHFLNNNKLNDWTYNKALQKIIESNRVDNEQKSVIKSMKR